MGEGTYHNFDLMEIFASYTTSNLVNLIYSPCIVVYEHILVQSSRIGNDLGDKESDVVFIDHHSLFLAISIKFTDQFRDRTFHSSSVRHSNLVPKPDVDVRMRNT